MTTYEDMHTIDLTTKDGNVSSILTIMNDEYLVRNVDGIEVSDLIKIRTYEIILDMTEDRYGGFIKFVNGD